MACILTGTGWQTITQKADEAESEFQLKVEMIASAGKAGGARSMAARNSQHCEADPF